MAADAPARPRARTATVAAVPDVSAALSEEMDRLNLAQALQDTDVATQRVQDITARLVSLGEENRALTLALEQAIADASAARAGQEQLQTVLGSKVFRLTVGVQRVRAALRRR
jgi:hypothetical protein